MFLAFDPDDAEQIRELRAIVASAACDLLFPEEPCRVDVDSPLAEPLQHDIGEKIRSADLTLCLVGRKAHRSHWLDWELEESIENGNALAAMFLDGLEQSAVPSLLERHGLEPQRWDAGELERIVRG